MESSHNMSAPADIENDIQKYMAKLELESRLASTPFYSGESVIGNWSNVQLLLEERENIRSCIAQLESVTYKEFLFKEESNKKIRKLAVGNLRNGLQRLDKRIEILCSQWSGLLCKMSNWELKQYYTNNQKSEELIKDVLRKAAANAVRRREFYKEYELDQNKMLEEFKNI